MLTIPFLFVSVLLFDGRSSRQAVIDGFESLLAYNMVVPAVLYSYTVYTSFFDPL